MSETDPLAFTRDPGLSELIAAAVPAWLWSSDASQILWSNAVGAAMFGATTVAALAERRFDPQHPAALQVARLADGLPPDGAPRLERLRGFVSGVGRLLTCRCAWLALADGRAAILIVATEPAGPSLPLAERVRRLFVGLDGSFAVFSADGTLIHAAADLAPVLGGKSTLAAIGADGLAAIALEQGRAAGETPSGLLTLERIGTGNPSILFATSAPLPRETSAGSMAEPDAAAPGEVDLAPGVSFGPASPDRADDSPRSEGLAGPAARPPSESPGSAALPAPMIQSGTERRQPLRFVWQVDREGRFTATSDEFIDLIGPAVAAALDRPWAEVAADLALDREGRFAGALASRDTFSGIAVAWPVEGTSERLAVELSGLPVFDRNRSFGGYRGFGICRDLARLAAIAAARRMPFVAPRETPPSADTAGVPEESVPATVPPTEAGKPEAPPPRDGAEASSSASAGETTDVIAPPPAERPQLSVVPPAKNVVPFRPALLSAAEKRPTLTPVERNAFQEIAKALGARVDGDVAAIPEADADPGDAAGGQPADEVRTEGPDGVAAAASTAPAPGAGGGTARDAQAPSAPPRPWPRAIPSAYAAGSEAAALRTPGQGNGERAVLDRLPIGVLIYRGDHLLHANRALLDWTGYEDVDAIAAAGGRERLFAEPGLAALGEPGGSERNLAITTRRGEAVAVEGRLFSVPWHGGTALLTVLVRKEAEERTRLANDALSMAEERVKAAEAALAASDERFRTAELALRSAQTATRELESILDTATDGVIVVDRDGLILSSNRSAEALFGYESHEIINRSFVDLFAPESHRAAYDYLNGLIRDGVASVLNDGREVIGRVQQGGLIPLFMTIRRIAEDKLCVVFRDITQWKRAEEDLTNAKREAEKASSAKSDVLAKVSHELRTPLNAIIGFAEVMMDERFGPIGNERYRQYLKDIRTSGEHVISLVNDLLDLSKIEAGKLELTFVSVKLNDLVLQCVAMMQPQANRERIIIRTSLLPVLPPVVADERSIRQIVLNLLSNSIKFTGAGGQVIVSTALTDQGEAVLRVRDTGIGMSEKEIETALEPFRQVATSGRSGSGTGLGLPLTKVLAEANRANFTIKSAVNAGTLVEITFPATRVLAE